MPKKMEVREGDRIQVWLKVARVADELDIDCRQIVTVELAGQRFTAPLDHFDVVRVQRGNNWPEG
ncbi:hypothetical protein FF80_03357 [Devosia sp. LC5]|uniref:hypothetical protein n=1 Tax=Devosia sp. LC5 TaxID=1502724 RepID=UPI0004E36BC8|nr:hypothetical protein [Devosia sp. LC5]KFC62790.1 hypothetical protein FF80_03357 [Devosia sp. LC5]